MAAPLNRQPNGLLDFFGIKNGGRNPFELGQILQPQLDLLPLYENAAPQVVGSASGSISAGGVTLFGPAGLTTSPGSSWHIRGASATFNATTVGHAIYARLGAYYNGTFIAFSPLAFGAQSVVGANYAQCAVSDLWLPPGWSLAFDVPGSGVAGTPTFVASWWAYEFRW